MIRSMAPTSKSKVVNKDDEVPKLIFLKGLTAEKVYYEYLHNNDVPTETLIDLGGGDGIHQTILDLTVKEEEDVATTSLLHEKSKRAMWFLDSHKTKTKYWVSMIDFTLNSESEGGIIGALPSHTSRPCWDCRHTFPTRVLGCPLRYNSCTQNSVERSRVEQKFRKSNLPITTLDFFETEGVFCSFPCIKSYILAQKTNSRYSNSSTLLTLLYTKLTGNPITYIPPSPGWKQLIEYGGHLTIKEYRATFGKLEFIETTNTRRPYMFSSSKYIEERRTKT